MGLKESCFLGAGEGAPSPPCVARLRERVPSGGVVVAGSLPCRETSAPGCIIERARRWTPRVASAGRRALERSMREDTSKRRQARDEPEPDLGDLDPAALPAVIKLFRVNAANAAAEAAQEIVQAERERFAYDVALNLASAWAPKLQAKQRADLERGRQSGLVEGIRATLAAQPAERSAEVLDLPPCPDKEAWEFWYASLARPNDNQKVLATFFCVTQSRVQRRLAKVCAYLDAGGKPPEVAGFGKTSAPRQRPRDPALLDARIHDDSRDFAH